MQYNSALFCLVGQQLFQCMHHVKRTLTPMTLRHTVCHYKIIVQWYPSFDLIITLTLMRIPSLVLDTVAAFPTPKDTMMID